MSTPIGIVLGCPRSGTTYLMSVLNATSQFECLTGTLLPVAIPHVVNQGLKPEVYDALAVGFERAIDAYLHSGRYHSRAAALHNWTKTPSNLRGLLHVLRGRRPLPDRFVYKEPFLSFAPGFVLDALPDARIIHIVRDGRDCANSLVRTYDVLTDEKLQHLRGSEMRLGRKVDDRYVPWWMDEGHDAAFLESSPYVRAIWMWKAMVRRCYERFFATRRAGKRPGHGAQIRRPGARPATAWRCRPRPSWWHAHESLQKTPGRCAHWISRKAPKENRRRDSSRGKDCWGRVSTVWIRYGRSLSRRTEVVDVQNKPRWQVHFC